MSDHSSSRTTEHWFLDLDGVRSGPYQTPEVMSLIAEGEVMPHHQIAKGLKDQSWMTILDWRFEQAKKPSVHEKEVRESYIPESERPRPAPLPPKVEIETTQTPEGVTPLHFEQVSLHSEKPVEKPAEETAAVLIEELKAEPIVLTPKQPPQPTAPAPKPIPTQTFKAPIEVSPSNETPSKRDPAAEMFDLIQTSKQKREAKTHQAAQQSQTQALNEASEDGMKSGIAKTVVIGVLITVIGFALGQLFQQSTPPQPKVTADPTRAPTPFVTNIPTSSPAVIDRSTDKIVIRKVETTTSRPAISAPQVKAATPTHSAKELEELKDLKKELQELKALKDELRLNNGGSTMDTSHSEPSDEQDSGVQNSEVDPSFNYYPSGPNPGTGGAVYDEDDGGQPPAAGTGRQPPNSGVHY